MAVYKRYKGKKISSKHPAYTKARWWIYKRIKGQPTIHQGVPEARTREEAELAERQLVKQMFDKSYGVTDTTTTFESFVESNYRKYVEQNNINKVAKNQYIRLLLGHFKNRPLHTITPQDCRDCRSKLQSKSFRAASAITSSKSEARESTSILDRSIRVGARRD